MTFREKIDVNKLPSHVAIIMDGNGRWAKSKGKLRVFGHQNGVKAVRDTVEGAAELGIQNLTLYAFSTENWSRPKIEVAALMELLVTTIHKETKTLMDNNIRLNAIGDLEQLPKSCSRELAEAMERTRNNSRLTLHLALSYSSRWEIVNAMKKMAQKIKNDELTIDSITDQLVASYLTTNTIPDPELLIRTSGEHRISNFLLWQIAYTELYFTNKLWPDFRREDLFEAIVSFQSRERRFGMTSEQVTT